MTEIDMFNEALSLPVDNIETPCQKLCNESPFQSREIEEIMQASIVPLTQNIPFQTGGNNDACTQEKEHHIEHQPGSIGASIPSVARTANVPHED